MISDKQLDANRANAQKSTGPQTDEGKQRSRFNASRHGLTGQILLLTPEQQPIYDRLKNGLIEEFAPATEHERQLVAEYATNLWHRQRAGNLEEGIFALGLIQGIADNIEIDDNPEAHQFLSNAKTFLKQAPALGLLSLYSQRLVNKGQKILKQIEACQSERKKSERHAIDEATVLYQYHQMQELPFDPKENGFVFSNLDIIEHIRRTVLRNRAYVAHKLDYDPPQFNERYPKAAA